VLTAVAIERVLQRGYYRPGIAFVTSIMDVTIVSAGLLGSWILNDPIISANSHLLFGCYFLAMAHRRCVYEPRVTLVSGLVAIVEYCALAPGVIGPHRGADGQAPNPAGSTGPRSSRAPSCCWR